MLARTGRRGQAAFDWQWFWHEYWHVRTVVRVKIRVSCASRYVVSVSLRCGARLYGKSCLARQYARVRSNFEKNLTCVPPTMLAEPTGQGFVSARSSLPRP